MWLNFVLDAVQAGCKNTRRHQIGIAIGTGYAVLDALRFWTASDGTDGGGAVVYAPQSRGWRPIAWNQTAVAVDVGRMYRHVITRQGLQAAHKPTHFITDVVWLAVIIKNRTAIQTLQRHMHMPALAGMLRIPFRHVRHHAVLLLRQHFGKGFEHGSVVCRTQCFHVLQSDFQLTWAGFFVKAFNRNVHAVTHVQQAFIKIVVD